MFRDEIENHRQKYIMKYVYAKVRGLEFCSVEFQGTKIKLKNIQRKKHLRNKIHLGRIFF